MTQTYYPLPDGEPTPDIARLVPSVISAQYLTDAEMAEHGVARCTVVEPVIEWWQQRGARQIDTGVSPHVISWAVEDRTLESAKAVAWQRIKAERDQRQAGSMPYTYPSGQTHHNAMSEKVVRDLSASTTAAIAIASSGVTDPVMPWTVEENVTHILTPAQMVAFGLSAMQWHSTIHMQSQAIRANIEAAATVQDVVAAAVWPGA